MMNKKRNLISKHPKQLKKNQLKQKKNVNLNLNLKKKQ